ncbi:MAG: hypothetical protein EOO90_04490 [Pedobacter sp.]|nr:MAG: hypothetical protein EOO90_04490 [Pedobacter sp.]
METNKDEESKTQIPVETDYEAHADNPGPAPTVNEPDNKGAGVAMKWIIPVVVVILLIIYFVYFRNNVTD